MRTGIDHLPPHKQRELERVVQILFEEFADAIALGCQDWKRQGRIQKVILYGSYARGGWVDEPHTAKGYRSDFDLLIIVSDERLADRVKFWVKAEDRLLRELVITKTLSTPVNFIVHTLAEVHQGLIEGRYFFMDVARDGIALYESEATELPEPKPKTPAEALALAREYFDDWFPSAEGRLDTARYTQGKGRLKEAAFDLHQAVERFYHCVLLVRTFYSPHSHHIGFLRTHAERLDRRLAIWPDDGRKDRARFEKLKAAYVKARYSKHYTIADDELDWLAAHAEALGQAVNLVCSERIAELEQVAQDAA